jgi:Leucine-rich repeat (LRR) protein
LDKKLSNQKLIKKIQNELYLKEDLEMDFFTLMQKLFEYQIDEYKKLGLELDEFKLPQAYDLESFIDRRVLILEYKLDELENILRLFPSGIAYLQTLNNPAVQKDKKSLISLMKIFLDSKQADIDLVDEIDLSNLELKRFPEDLKRFRNLKKLDLSLNLIKKVPSWIAEFKNLEDLFLSINKLETLPKEICQLNKLKILDLFKNELKELPLKFAKLESIIALNLSNNEFTIFPDQISKLKNIRKLHFGFNHLKQIDVVFDSKNLDELDLRFNNLEIFPAFIGRQTNLEKLILNENKIRYLPLELDNLIKLRIFKIKNNPLNFETLPRFQNRVISDLLYRLIPRPLNVELH